MFCIFYPVEDEMMCKIGVFDSGIGGLTVLHSCVNRVEGEYYYYGDNLNAPYGTKSEEEIYALSKRAFELFLRLRVDAAVIACNTVTAVCIDRLRREYPFPIVGTEPAVALAAKHHKKCLLLATRATLSSERVHKLLAAFPKTEFTLLAPDGLVEEIEKKRTELSRVDLSFLNGFSDVGVVLGCTHFVWLKERIEKFFPVYDGNEGIASRLHAMIEGMKGTENHILKGEEAREGMTLKTNKNVKICFLGGDFVKNYEIYEQMFF